MEFEVLLLAVSFFGFTAADIIKSEGKTRKIFARTNIILAGVFLLGLIYAFIDAGIVDRDREKYKIDGQSLFGGISYNGETDDFYLLYESAFLSSGTDIAVPKKRCISLRLPKYLTLC